MADYQGETQRLVYEMNTCVSGKRSYASQNIALEALIQNRIRNKYVEGQGPVNVYACEECGQWHFTSRGNMATKLNDPEVRRRIDLEGEAFDWEQKLR